MELIHTGPQRGSWLRRQIRSWWRGPFGSGDRELARFFASGPQTTTGLHIDPESALSHAPVWAAVNVIASDIAKLPLIHYKRLQGGGKEKFVGHPIYRLLHNRPNPEQTPIVFKRLVQAHALLWGNGYAEIQRNNAGVPVALWPLHPDTVQTVRDSRGMAYRVTDPDGNQSNIPASDMVHIPGLGIHDWGGSSLVGKARESIAMGLAAERFGGTFFGNGSTFGGAIQHPTAFKSDTNRQNFLKALHNKHQGVENAHRFLLLEEGMTYQRFGVAPNEAQFLETRQFQVTDIARWFNIPAHKINDLLRATFSNIEQLSIDYYTQTLIPWLETWEQELEAKLIPQLEQSQQFIEHTTNALLRGDQASRGEFYTKLFNIGAITPNEIRDLENMNPIPGGEKAYVQGAYVPLEKAPELAEAQIEKAKQPPQPPVAPKGNDDADREALRKALEALTAARDQEATEKRQALQKAEDLSAARDEAEAARDAALADLVHVRELLAGAEQALGEEKTERAKEKADLVLKLDLEHDERMSAEEHRDGLQARLDSALAAQAASVEALAAVEAARQADQATHAAERDALSKERDEAIAARDAAESRRDDATSGYASALAENALLRQDVAMAERDKAIAEQAQAAANATIATLQAELQQARTNHAERVTGVLVAHRALIADVMRRVVERETERARKHAWNPQKLRAWIDTFYSDKGVADVAAALLPAVRAHLSILSSTCDPRELAQQLAEDHVATSAKQLRDLLLVDDYAPILERTLTHWEDTRPEQVADRLLTKGLADVR